MPWCCYDTLIKIIDTIAGSDSELDELFIDYESDEINDAWSLPNDNNINEEYECDNDIDQELFSDDEPLASIAKKKKIQF